MSLIDWPPAYTLRKSARARRIQMRVTPDKGLEVIVPLRMSQKSALQFMDSQRDWVIKSLQACQARLQQQPPITAPTQIDLLASAQVWQISYQPSYRVKHGFMCQPQQRLVLAHAPDDLPAVFASLKRWLCQQAELVLLPKLAELSHLTELKFNAAAIRSAKTLWGSCSAQKNISLSCQLLFLPNHLVEHILLHELCHTVHMNHSRRFWSLLNQHDAQCLEHRKQLLQAQKVLPRWLKHL